MQPLFQDQATKTVAPAGFIDITQKSVNIVPVAQPQTTTLTIVADNEIDQLGSRVGGNASKTAQLILASVKASDVDGFGTKLNELIAVSKQMDPKKMGKPGLLSKVTGFFGATKEKMLAQYETVEKRMNTLVGEMDKTVSLQQTRINDLEQMYIDNERAFYAYGEEITQAQTYVEQLKLALAAEQANATTDMFASQRQHDIQAHIGIRHNGRYEDARCCCQVCAASDGLFGSIHSTEAHRLRTTNCSVDDITGYVDEAMYLPAGQSPHQS